MSLVLPYLDFLILYIFNFKYVLLLVSLYYSSYFIFIKTKAFSVILREILNFYRLLAGLQSRD